MKFAKPALMVVGCVLLTGLTLTLFAPKTVHALAAALVQITNTRSNPVPTQDVDIAARQQRGIRCLPTHARAAHNWLRNCHSKREHLTESRFRHRPAIRDGV